MTNETAPDLNFRCCGCGEIWTESHFPCDCPTDVLFQQDGKNKRLKSVWVKAKEETALEAAQARIAELEGALRGALTVIDDYLGYEHDGDPWTEDARQMGEMDINEYQRDGRLEAARAALEGRA